MAETATYHHEASDSHTHEPLLRLLGPVSGTWPQDTVPEDRQSGGQGIRQDTPKPGFAILYL